MGEKSKTCSVLEARFERKIDFRDFDIKIKTMIIGQNFNFWPKTSNSCAILSARLGGGGGGDTSFWA